jgi:CHASE2 domain-containing sensor protein
MRDFGKIILFIAYQLLSSIIMGIILSKLFANNNNWGDLIGMVVGIYLGFIIAVSTILINLLRKLKIKKRYLIITPILLSISLFILLWLISIISNYTQYNIIIIFLLTNLVIIYLYYKSKKIKIL